MRAPVALVILVGATLGSPLVVRTNGSGDASVAPTKAKAIAHA
jgi:hypothetical protein